MIVSNILIFKGFLCINMRPYLKVVVAVAVIVIVIGAIAGYVLLSKPVIPTKETVLETNTDNIAEVKIGNIDIKKAGVSATPKVPWTADFDTTNYYTPDTVTLDTIYKEYITAKTNRDYQQFSRVASAHLKWLYDNNTITVGFNDAGKAVAKSAELKGEEYFKKYAAHKVNQYTPQNLSLYEPIRAEKSECPVEDNDVVIIDDVNNSSYFYSNKSIKNCYALYYKINELANNGIKKSHIEEDFDGMVLFSFEDSKWKLFTEDWRLLPIQGVPVGDIQTTGMVLHELRKISADKYTQFTPEEIRIKAGEMIAWSYAYGVIGSTSQTEGLKPWASQRLMNQTYSKIFNEKGTYNYTIIFWSQSFNGKIVVE